MKFAKLLTKLIALSITLLNLISISYAAKTSKDCTLNLLWGHGGAGHVEDKIEELGIKGQNLYQGCGVGGSGDIKYQVWQTGYNGDWMPALTHLDNGGFTPIMSQKGQEIVSKIGNVHDKTRLESKKREYDMNETQWVFDKSEQFRVGYEDLAIGIKSVGFTRLTHYHWAALIKKADDLISTKACKKVSINFICHDEKSKGWPLNKRTYKNRVNQAQFKHLNIDKSLLKDVESNNIVYQPKKCTKSSSGKMIDSVPRTCGESHMVTAKTLAAYKASKCGPFLKKVTSKYKRTRKLDGRAEIFRGEETSVQDSYQAPGSSEQ